MEVICANREAFCIATSQTDTHSFFFESGLHVFFSLKEMNIPLRVFFFFSGLIDESCQAENALPP